MSKQSLQFAANVNDFTFNMYRRLATKPGNVFSSPKNMLDCLAMVYGGARGGTAEAMQNACLFPTDPDEACYEIGLVNKSLADQKDCTVRTANGVWAQEDYNFNTNYTDSLRQNFGAEFRKVNYKDASTHETIANDANKWVEEVTKGEDGEGKIKNLLSKDFFSTESVLTLVSAIYFLGKWKTEFKPKDTKSQPFILADGSKEDCKLMTRHSEDVRYFENDTFQMVDLPYVGDQLRMAVFLPWLKNGIVGLEKWLKADNFNKTVRATRPTDTIVHLPKWKVTAEADLKAPLCDMGMEIAFTDRANFKGMIEEGSAEEAEGLKISKAIHKAFVDVTEKGTEAAAATAVGMARCCSAVMEPPKPKIFRADHPFLYVIHHIPSGTALFLGRHSKPQGY